MVDVGGSQWNSEYCYCSSQLSSMNAKPFLVAVQASPCMVMVMVIHIQ